MPDVNILVYAHREDEKWHAPYARWLEQAIDGPEPFALSTLVAVAFVRIVTNRRIYADPTPLPVALAVIEQIMGHPRCRVATPSPAHLGEVLRLCRVASATAKLVADAQHAALAMAEGCIWVTRDGDFTRFEPHGLRWQHLVLE
ncbi:MAG TPA: TA system VapC family ribonuclease toxin [Steroidobacteraceae bacterium]|nr:TA system VapC family ribonuclease toxin [Steroidobacteraceae bacterium]